MGEEQQNQQSAEPQLLPPTLPEGHQPVNTEVLVRGAGLQGVETKIIQADKQK